MTAVLEAPAATDTTAIVVRALGGPEVLRLDTVALRAPGPGEVRVDVAHAGVNFAETERRRGVYEAVSLPWVPGCEATGTIVAVGDGVRASHVGRRVAVLAPTRETTGTYARSVVVPLARTFAIPDGLHPEVAAALPMQGLTAWHVVHTMGDVRAGQTVVVHAAAGGVGGLAAQLARLAGARVIGTTSRASKVDAVAASGAEPLLLGEGDAWVEEVRARTGGRGADVVLDGLGARTGLADLDALALLGQVVFYGESSGPAPAIEPGLLYDRGLRVSALSLWAPLPDETLRQSFASLFTLAASGALRTPVSAVLPLAEAAEAHRRMEAGETTGKMLLVP